MSEGTVLTIFGSFISLLLMVNAYFTRETLVRLVAIEVKMGSNDMRQTYNERQLNTNTDELNSLRFRMHTVEGAQASMLKFIDDTEKYYNKQEK